MIRIHSPGRINIIGEHTDYTGGYVMPAAIDKGIVFEAEPTEGKQLRLHARDLDEHFDLDLPVTGRTGELWVDYLAGIVRQFQQLGHAVPALRIAFGGDIPRGSGMSSSAALEGGMAFLLNEVIFGGEDERRQKLSRPALARLCQRSSNEFLGIPSGIMDQFASLNGSAEGPIRLNCHTLAYSAVDADLPGYSWLLVNSMVTHSLDGGEYHTRVRECAEALGHLRKDYPTLSHLSAATTAQLYTLKTRMPAAIYARAEHVVSENGRVHAMSQALREGDAAAVGRLLNASHASLRDDYAVSCAKVDFLQETAVNLAGGPVLGARIMGGGFGGCTLNFVRSSAIDDIKQQLRTKYLGRYGTQPEFYEVRIGPGTRLL